MSRAQSGFWNFKYDRNEQIGPWQTQVWNVESLDFYSKTRREHLEAYPLPHFLKHKSKNTSFMIANSTEQDEFSSDEETEQEKLDQYKYGYRNIDEFKDEHTESIQAARKAFKKLTKFRPTLDPPPLHPMTFEEFMKYDKECVHLGRPLIEESHSKSLKATMWIHPEESMLGVQLSSILPLLDLIGMGSNEHIRSLREFFNVQLPRGFPVQVEIPLGAIPLSGLVKFDKVELNKELEMELFDLPTGYVDGIVL